MTRFRYEPIHPIGKEELEDLLESGDAESVARALYAATRYEGDWRWVEDHCLKCLKSPEVLVRWAAATCFGDLALMRRPLKVDFVVAALENALKDPEIAEPAGISLSMVKQFLCQ